MPQNHSSLLNSAELALKIGLKGVYLADLIGLAEKAGSAIMDYYTSGDWTITDKKDESPLTQADLASNEILLKSLSQWTTDPIVSEEGVGPREKPGPRFWLIDPLDGTRDFIGKKDTFVICMGLVVDGFAAFGLIHSPVTKETWWAAEKFGAYGPNGDRLAVNKVRSKMNHDLVAAGSRSMLSERMKVLHERFSIREVRKLGSALKFCKIAEGEVDLYPRFGPTYEWDTAAGQIILEEAGGRLDNLATGQRMQYGKPGLENAGGFLATRSDLEFVDEMRSLSLIK